MDTGRVIHNKESIWRIMTEIDRSLSENPYHDGWFPIGEIKQHLESQQLISGWRTLLKRTLDAMVADGNLEKRECRVGAFKLIEVQYRRIIR